MKLAAALFALASVSAFATAGEDPAAAPAEPCAVPKIPAVSTSQVGAERVQKQLKKWYDCVAKVKTDPALIAQVDAEAQAWARASSRDPIGAQLKAAQRANDRMREKPSISGEGLPAATPPRSQDTI